MPINISKWKEDTVKITFLCVSLLLLLQSGLVLIQDTWISVSYRRMCHMSAVIYMILIQKNHES